ETLWTNFIDRDDRTAFEALVLHYKDNVFDLALRLLRNRALAEDVAQDVFVTMYTKRESRKSDVPLRAWLLKITRNAAIDCLRANQKLKNREEGYAMSRAQTAEKRAPDVGADEMRR